jgi:hypothetical protein
MPKLPENGVADAEDDPLPLLAVEIKRPMIKPRTHKR